MEKNLLSIEKSLILHCYVCRLKDSFVTCLLKTYFNPYSSHIYKHIFNKDFLHTCFQYISIGLRDMWITSLFIFISLSFFYNRIQRKSFFLLILMKDFVNKSANLFSTDDIHTRSWYRHIWYFTRHKIIYLFIRNTCNICQVIYIYIST